MTNMPANTVGTCWNAFCRETYQLAIDRPGEKLIVKKADWSKCFFKFHIDLDSAPLMAYTIGPRALISGIPLRVPQGSKGGSHFCGHLGNFIARRFCDRSTDDSLWRPNAPHVLDGSIATGANEEEDQATAQTDTLYPQRDRPMEESHFARCYTDDTFIVTFRAVAIRCHALIFDTVWGVWEPLRRRESDAGARESPVSMKKLPDVAASAGKEVLGYWFSARRLTATVMPEKAAKIATLIRKMIPPGAPTCDASELISVAGKLQFASRVRAFGRLRMKRIYNGMTQCNVTRTRSSAGGDAKYTVHLREGEVAELRDWLRFLDEPEQCPLALLVEKSATDWECAADASGEIGIGGYFKLNGTFYVWRIAHPEHIAHALTREKGAAGQNLTICDFELGGQIITIMHFGEQVAKSGGTLAGCVIQVDCDNRAAEAWVNGQTAGTHVSLAMMGELKAHCHDHQYLARIKWIPGVDNIVAD